MSERGLAATPVQLSGPLSKFPFVNNPLSTLLPPQALMTGAVALSLLAVDPPELQAEFKPKTNARPDNHICDIFKNFVPIFFLNN
jgi:hypothetical protein